MKVIVVGAGAAGMSAAHTLRKAGVDVTVLESTKYAGGRAANYSKNGFILDTGAQFLGKVCTTEVGYAKEFGIEDEILKFDLESAFWRNGKIYPMPKSTLMGFITRFDRLLRFRGIPFSANKEIARVFYHMIKRVINVDADAMNSDCLIPLADMSVAEFTLKYGGKQALDWLMRPACGGMVIGEPEDISITHIISLLSLYKGLYLMKRGIGSIVEALYQANKDNIKLSSPVKKIVIDNNKIKGVDTGKGFIAADHVICATTASAAVKLMPGLPYSIRRALDTVRYSSTIHLMLGMPERILPGKLYVVSLPTEANSFLCALNDASGKSKEMAPEGTGLGHLCAYGNRVPEFWQMSDEEIISRILKETARLGGNVKKQPIVADVIRWKEAICLEPPGQLPEMYWMKRTAKNDVRGLHLAGEYNYHVSCVEGAMRSGVDAASDILAETKNIKPKSKSKTR